jgi:branched-chain amino acid transport system substrate-binding protein
MTSEGKKSKLSSKTVLAVIVLVIVVIAAVSLYISSRPPVSPVSTVASTSVAARSSVEPIKIGATVSLTGSFASGGKEVLDGYLAWQRVVNDAGGLLGRPVQVIYYDDQSNPTLAASLYEKLITVDKVQFTFGPFSSPITFTASTVTEKYHIIMLDSLGWASTIFTRGYKYVFLASNVAGENVSIVFIDWLNSLPAAQKPKTYGIAIATDTISQALANGFEKLANQAGLIEVANEQFAPSATDLTNVFLKVKQANPDVLLLSSISNPSIILAIRTMHQINFTPKAIFGLDTMGLPEIHEALGPLMDNMMFDEVYFPTSGFLAYPGAQQFLTVYTASTGKYPESHASIAFACGQILQQAITGSGSLDSDQVRNYIATHTFNTVNGPISFKSNGLPADPSDILVQWQSSKMQVVFPTKVANATAIYPFMWGA